MDKGLDTQEGSIWRDLGSGIAFPERRRSWAGSQPDLLEPRQSIAVFWTSKGWEEEKSADCHHRGLWAAGEFKGGGDGPRMAGRKRSV